jgi:hypothetical protein
MSGSDLIPSAGNDAAGRNTGCFKKSFTMVIEIVPLGKYYENIYT